MNFVQYSYELFRSRGVTCGDLHSRGTGADLGGGGGGGSRGPDPPFPI